VSDKFYIGRIDSAPRSGEGTVAGWNGESLILAKVDGKLHEIHFSLIVQETEKETKE